MAFKTASRQSKFVSAARPFRNLIGVIPVATITAFNFHVVLPTSLYFIPHVHLVSLYNREYIPYTFSVLLQ